MDEIKFWGFVSGCWVVYHWVAFGGVWVGWRWTEEVRRSWA